MKKLFNKHISLIGIVIAGLFVVYFALLILGSKATTLNYRVEDGGQEIISTPDDRSADTSFGGLNFARMHTIPDSISYAEGKHLEDSIKQIQEQLDGENIHPFVERTSAGFIGVATMPIFSPVMDKIMPFDTAFHHLDDTLYIMYKDLHGIKDSLQRTRRKVFVDSLEKEYQKKKLLREESNKVHYLTLTGYSLADSHSTFYVSLGKYYLKQVQWDSAKKTPIDSNRWGHFVSKEIPLRYSPAEKMIMIPITESRYKNISWMITASFMLISLLAVYFFLGLPILLLVNISKGNAFIPKNISVLNQMSVMLFIFFCLHVFSPYLIRWIFSEKITADFALPRLSEKIGTYFYLLLFSVVLFLIGRAFKKGCKLQQEQDLTV